MAMTVFTSIALGRLFLRGGDARIEDRLLARANADLDARRGDLVAFGRPFIANPGLVRDLESGHALTAPDSSTFYTVGERGYTDY
jgi:2,4-dienoyl-CoA reductase-like NADH-dependent reductase (Old Yellow Enzyme family)